MPLKKELLLDEPGYSTNEWSFMRELFRNYEVTMKFQIYFRRHELALLSSP